MCNPLTSCKDLDSDHFPSAFIEHVVGKQRVVRRCLGPNCLFTSRLGAPLWPCCLPVVDACPQNDLNMQTNSKHTSRFSFSPLSLYLQGISAKLFLCIWACGLSVHTVFLIMRDWTIGALAEVCALYRVKNVFCTKIILHVDVLYCH